MKLIEKMAQEYSAHINETDIPGAIKSEKEAYEAGFRAAREMAAQHMDFVLSPNCPPEMNMYAIPRQIRKIGEEKV